MIKIIIIAAAITIINLLLLICQPGNMTSFVILEERESWTVSASAFEIGITSK